MPQSRNMSWRLLLGKPVGPKQVWEKGWGLSQGCFPKWSTAVQDGGLVWGCAQPPWQCIPLGSSSLEVGEGGRLYLGRGEGQSCLSHPRTLWAQPPYTLMWGNEPAMEDP